MKSTLYISNEYAGEIFEETPDYLGLVEIEHIEMDLLRLLYRGRYLNKQTGSRYIPISAHVILRREDSSMILINDTTIIAGEYQDKLSCPGGLLVDDYGDGIDDGINFINLNIMGTIVYQLTQDRTAFMNRYYYYMNNDSISDNLPNILNDFSIRIYGVDDSRLYYYYVPGRCLQLFYMVDADLDDYSDDRYVIFTQKDCDNIKNIFDAFKNRNIPYKLRVANTRRVYNSTAIDNPICGDDFRLQKPPFTNVSNVVMNTIK